MLDDAGFDAFISYSRKDVTFARALEKSLKGYRPPRGLDRAQRHLRVFRDEADFTGGEYTEALRRHLKAARKLIVLCSPAARASRYVDEEIRLFAELHGIDDIVPVLLSGIPNNEAGSGQDADLAFPSSLCRLMAVPLAADYRGFDSERPRPDRGIHESAWFKLLADVYGVPRSEIEQREKRRQATVRRRWIGGTAAVVASLSALSVWALVSRAEAIRQGEISAAGLITAQARTLSGPEIEIAERQALLAIEAIQRLRERGASTEDAEAVLAIALERLPLRVQTFPPQPTPPVLAFSRDGTRLFRAIGPRLEAWNARAMSVEETFDLASPATRIDVSTDGDWVATADPAGAISMTFVGEPSPFDTAGKPTANVPPTRGSVVGAFSDDGTLYATAHQPDAGRYEILVWGVRSGEIVGRMPLAEFTPPGGRDVAPPRLSFNHRSRIGTGAPLALLLTFASAAGDGLSALAWIDFSRPPHRWSKVAGAAFNRDGDRVLLTRAPNGTTGELVNAALADWKEEVSRVARVGEISPDGRRYLTFSGTAEDPYVHSMSGTVTEVRDTLDGSVRVELAAAGAFSTGGDRYLAISDRLLRIFDLTTGDEVIRVRTDRPIASARDSRGGRYAALTFADHSVEIWDTGHPQEMSRVASVESGALVADGRFATVEGKQGTRLFDVAKGRAVAHLTGSGIFSLGFPVFAPVVSPDGTRALSYVGVDGKRLFDLTRSGRVLWQSKNARWAAFSPDSKMLVVEADGVLHALNAVDGAERWQLRVASSIENVDFGSAGREVVVSAMGEALLIDAATGTVRRRLSGRTTAAGTDAGGTRIAAAASETVAVASAGSETPIKISLPKTMEEVAAISFLPDGQRLVTVAGHKEYIEGSFLVPGQFTELAAFVWDTTSAKLLARIPSGSDRASNYIETLQENDKAYLADPVLTKDGRAFGATVFRSRGDYWTVKEDRVSRSAVVWDLTGTLPREIMRRPAALMKDISDDGRLVLLAMPQALEVWSLDRRGLEKAACARVSRDLDSAEWKAFFGERPYHATCGKKR